MASLLKLRGSKIGSRKFYLEVLSLYNRGFHGNPGYGGGSAGGWHASCLRTRTILGYNWIQKDR